jgi:hypothetical protein
MASYIKLYTFQVTGLSRELPDSNLKTDRDLRIVIKEVLDDNFTDNKRLQIKAKVIIIPLY